MTAPRPAGRRLRVALVGAGVAGQAHAFGWRNVAMAPDLAGTAIELVTVADPNRALAETVADRYGFAETVADPERVAGDGRIDVVSVAVPNHLHARVLPPLLRSGKHVFTEKPLGVGVSDARALRELAGASDAVTAVGFSFRRLPALAALGQVLADGRLGAPRHFHAWYYADYSAAADAPFTWRHDRELAGAGALIDIGTHVIDAVQLLLGPVTDVLSCQLTTVVGQRPAGGAMREVTTDDVALLAVRMASGAVGQIDLSRVATGTPNSLGVTVHAADGNAGFDSIAGNEFSVFQASSADELTNGPRRVFAGPQHPYFGATAPMPGAGVGTGYGEAFVAEIQEFVRCIQQGRRMDTDFDNALGVMRVVDAALRAADAGVPVPVPSGG